MTRSISRYLFVLCCAWLSSSVVAAVGPALGTETRLLPDDPSPVSLAKRFRDLLHRHEYDSARAMMSADPRRWWGKREGEGRPWKIGPEAKGPWSGWDERMHGTSEVLGWKEADGSATATVRETNDYFRMLERGWVTNEVTYFIDGDGKIDGWQVDAAGERPPGRTAEFLAWAKTHEPEEIAAVMPDDDVDPSGDHPQRFHALLERWRASAGLDPGVLIRNEPSPRVLLLGTFHFQDAGRDNYKPAFPIDILSPRRQAELDTIIRRLAAWRPTLVAIEQRPERQARIDSMYAIYPANGMDTLRNEIYQVGFRLAKRLGLPGVVCVDDWGAHLPGPETEEAWDSAAAALAPGMYSETDWDARYTALYHMDDSLKSVWPLTETYLRMNSPDRIRTGHGHYLVGTMLNGRPGEYLGADGFVSSWYNRNLRIYSNILRVARDPGERILVIYGAGHMAILHSLMESSPAVKLDDVNAVLNGDGAGDGAAGDDAMEDGE